jgi:hypothetical protein
VEGQSAAASEEALFPFCREPSYFEIPTKEFQQPSQIAESTIHEIPTKDTPSSHTAGAGHASFTIEFDDSTPGKVTIRDHVTKFTSDQRHKSKKASPGTQDLPGIQTGMMAPENKVADWLAQNNPPQMVWERTEEDSKSIKSDVPVYLKRLKGKVIFRDSYCIISYQTDYCYLIIHWKISFSKFTFNFKAQEQTALFMSRFLIHISFSLFSCQNHIGLGMAGYLCHLISLPAEIKIY